MAKINSVAQVVVDNSVDAPSIPSNDEIKIETGVAIPASARSGGKAKYPWTALAPEQSFFIAGAKVETFYTLCSTASKKHGCKFIARKWTGEGGVKGVRVWRTKD